MTTDPGPVIDEAVGPGTERRAVLLAIGAAALSALVVPDTAPGLGTTLVAFAVAAAIVSARPIPLDRPSLSFGALALLLSAMPTVRAAEWLLAFDVLAAVALGLVAVSGAATWKEIFALPVRALTRTAGAFRFVLEPVVRRSGLRRRVGPAIRGVALTSILLVVFGALFATADRAFAEIVGDLVPDLDVGLIPARIVVFGVVLLGTGVMILSGRRYADASEGGGEAPSSKVIGRGEWITALALLDLLFALFVGVQVAVFFGGRSHVVETSGLTFAEYARQGFFQLVAVGLLTFGVIGGAVRWARRDRQRDEAVMRLLLGALCLLTLVVLVSAFQRLTLYESVFGYTRLRLSVHAVILWMGAIFVVVLLAGVAKRARWLPRLVVGLSGLGLLAFNAIDPDHLIASKNVERYSATGDIDLAYLSSLSPDAVPALLRLPPKLQTCALSVLADPSEEERSWLAWSYGRQRAMDALPAAQPSTDSAACLALSRNGVS